MICFNMTITAKRSLLFYTYIVSNIHGFVNTAIYDFPKMNFDCFQKKDLLIPYL